MTKSKNRRAQSQITDMEISVCKGMLLRGDKQQSIVAYFGGKLNSGRVCEIHHSMTRDLSDDEPPLTKRARDIETATEDLPPPPPYISPYEARRAQAAFRSAADSIWSTIEKEQTTLAMLDRVLK